jgi:hypothetical protein
MVAMLIPIGGLTLGLSGVAGAATGKIVCTTITGNATGNITVSGCTGGNTGGSSEPLSATALATGGTVDWVSGSTTTSTAPVLKLVTATKCPGYVKNAASNPIAESFKASVTADSGDSILVPGTETGEVCVGTDGTISVLKDLEISWKESSISCTAVSGNATGNITVSGCTGGDTGGSSAALPALTLATGGTIPWTSGSSTTISAPTLKATSATKCPGYVKGGSANPSAEKFTATVTTDTGDGLKIPGKASGAVCLASDGTITALGKLAVS